MEKYSSEKYALEKIHFGKIIWKSDQPTYLPTTDAATSKFNYRKTLCNHILDDQHRVLFKTSVSAKTSLFPNTTSADFYVDLTLTLTPPLAPWNFSENSSILVTAGFP